MYGDGPLKVEQYGNPILRNPCAPVTVFDDDLNAFAGRMTEILYEQKGAGLAAPQVGVPRRLAIIDLSFGEEEAGSILVLVNPELLSAEGECTIEEACLSIPGISENVSRAERIRVRFQNLAGESEKIAVDGYLARVIQHEMDHLDGVLFVDRVGAFRRTFLAKALRDLSRQQNG